MPHIPAPKGCNPRVALTTYCRRIRRQAAPQLRPVPPGRSASRNPAGRVSSLVQTSVDDRSRRGILSTNEHFVPVIWQAPAFERVPFTSAWMQQVSSRPWCFDPTRSSPRIAGCLVFGHGHCSEVLSLCTRVLSSVNREHPHSQKKHRELTGEVMRLPVF